MILIYQKMTVRSSEIVLPEESVEPIVLPSLESLDKEVCPSPEEKKQLLENFLAKKVAIDWDHESSPVVLNIKLKLTPGDFKLIEKLGGFGQTEIKYVLKNSVRGSSKKRSLGVIDGSIVHSLSVDNDWDHLTVMIGDKSSEPLDITCFQEAPVKKSSSLAREISNPLDYVDVNGLLNNNEYLKDLGIFFSAYDDSEYSDHGTRKIKGIIHLNGEIFEFRGSASYKNGTIFFDEFFLPDIRNQTVIIPPFELRNENIEGSKQSLQMLYSCLRLEGLEREGKLNKNNQEGYMKSIAEEIARLSS